MTKAASHTIRLLLSAVIIAALVLFARRVDWHTTWQGIAHADRTVLLAAMIVNLVSLLLKATRWWVFLRPVGARSFWLAVRATFAGAGLNNILVANGGEAARVVFVARTAHLPSARVLATLALERTFEVVGYIIMLVLSVSFLRLPPVLARTRPLAWGALALLAIFLIYLLRRPRNAVVAAADATHWRGRVAGFFRHFTQTVAELSTGPRFAAALVLSVGVWATQVWTYALTARSAGFNLPLVGTVAALLVVNIGFLARATPGNVGVFQAAYAVTAVAFGMDKDEAIAVAFLIQAQQIIPVTLLGIALAPEFVFKRRGRASDDGLKLGSRGEEPAG